MKMINKTNKTSTNGVTLISEIIRRFFEDLWFGEKDILEDGHAELVEARFKFILRQPRVT